MFDEVFPYIWIHLMDVPKGFNKNTGWNTLLLADSWPTTQNLQAAVTSLIQLLDPNVGAAKVEWDGWWEGGNWYIYLYTFKKPKINHRNVGKYSFRPMDPSWDPLYFFG